MALELDGARGPVAAVLFMQAGMYAMDSMSTLNSSPWTSENFGADPDKAKSAREYVLHSIAVSSVFCVTSAVIAKSWWPILGALATDSYLFWIYERALKRGADAGSDGWAKQP